MSQNNVSGIPKNQINASFVNLNLSQTINLKNSQILSPRAGSMSPNNIRQGKSPLINKSLLRNMELKPDTIAILDKYKEMLLRIFRAYSSFCGNTSTYKLSSSKLLKLLMHSKLIKETEVLH